MILKYKKLHNMQFCEEKKNHNLVTNSRRRKCRKMNRRGEKRERKRNLRQKTILFPYFIIPNLTHEYCKNQ
jgi:hypothetical protein